MTFDLRHWAAPAVLLAGAILVVGVDVQREVPLRAPLTTSVPARMLGLEGQDLTMPSEEVRVAGMTNYLLRVYEPNGAAGGAGFSVYVGYYESQARGRTIHSPKNCLPGAGWEPLASESATISTPTGVVTVNRYLLQNGEEQALVFYWYQGRGRIESNEYRVKWDLLRDSALRGRSEEALVRVLVPIRGDPTQAQQVAVNAVRELVPAVGSALPL